jgi:glycosyltransferase involved in cell wall biosynthesis
VIASVLVTHNSERWLRATLESIANQTRKPDSIIVIDDNSTDGTTTILTEFGITPIAATTTSTDVITRIAQNFQQGVRAARDADVVVLGDHDDIWHPTRVERQASLLESMNDQNSGTHANSQLLMVASDGTLVDENGAATGGTLRSTFPVAANWNDLPANEQLAYALRHSLATGGASAIRPGYFVEQEIPEGWLHDRWWSLLATVRLGMLIDAESVIDYRVQGSQQVGLDTGTQAMGSAQKATSRAANLKLSMRKLKDLSSTLRAQCSTPALWKQLSTSSLLRHSL